jgi:hypothetical protein
MIHVYSCTGTYPGLILDERLTPTEYSTRVLVRFLKTCFSSIGVQYYLFGFFVNQPQNSQEFTKWC